MTASRKSIAIDDELFNEVRAILGTTTLRETVEEAFQQVRRDVARREEIATLTRMRGMDLAKPRIMVRAWRT